MRLENLLFENLHRFYSFKVQHISNFTIVEKENVPFLQEYTIITWWIKFYWLSIMQGLSLLSKLLVKIKRSEVFAIHNDMQKLRFCKLFTERSFRRRKLIKLKICDCKRKPYTSFSLSTSKVLQSRFENVPISFCSFKDNGLKLLDSSSTTFSSYLAVRSVFFWKNSQLFSKFYCVCMFL